MTTYPSDEEKSRISEILGEAQERLNTAQVGLDLARRGPDLVKSGLRNVAIFGKMVTFCSNNLRGKVDGFQEWDRGAKQKYFENDIARAMSDARNQFEKQASNPISSATYIKSFSTQDLATFPKPPNAIGFFIGDRMGGSGWMVQMENGDRVRFYIDLPPEIGESKTILRHGGKALDLIGAAEEYLHSLQSYLNDLRAFVGERTAG
jgi:hypothetical protein